MNIPKIIAFYLPQFHVIPENDEWWGKGFTEWTNVKKAIPLFRAHNQPRVPYKENYYDLSCVEEMYKQAELAKEYKVDGFCYYHYWFKGKKLLNTPLENMLNDKGVNIGFCLSWANEPWTRAWDGGNREILMPQEYGNSCDWDEHIKYLIPFFRDERYIKVDEKPVFLIYRTNNFRFDDMIKHWKSRLLDEGIKGLYIVETLNSFQSEPTCEESSAVLEFEPMYTLSKSYNVMERVYRRLKKNIFNKGLLKISYSEIWEKILRRKRVNSLNGKKVFYGGFIDWDNTPRKGKRGLVLTESSPQLFEKHFRKLYNLKNSEMIFLNAWNEWAEGTYLEPDTKNGFEYLEAIKNIVLRKKNK